MLSTVVFLIQYKFPAQTISISTRKSKLITFLLLYYDHSGNLLLYCLLGDQSWTR